MKKVITIIVSLSLLTSIITLSGCSKTVTEYDLNITFSGNTYVGKFSGTIKNKIPADNTTGKFVSGNKGTGNYLEYNGEWKNGTFFGKGTLEQEAYTVKYNDNDIAGIFKGDTVNGIPNGNGTFNADTKNDLVFEYNGSWKDGQIFENGKLKFNKYIIKYSDGIVRTGVFEGEVVNGIPQGSGTYTTANDDNEKYTYEGEFFEGKFNGKGKMSFENGENGIQIGNWKDNDFYPTLVERIQELGTYKNNCEYKLSDKQIDFINKNETIFTKHEYSESIINKQFDLKSFKKNPSGINPSLVRVTNLKVIQISEYKGFGEKHITNLLACDSDYETYYYIYKLDKTKGIVEGNTIQLVFIPLSYSTYETVGGGTNWAVAGFAADIKK